MTILNSNIDKIHDGIGDKLGLLVQLSAKFVISIVIAFFRGWKMTLVMLSLAPFIWIVSIISSKVYFYSLLYIKCFHLFLVV
jgi:ATP-binding cassette subfamily B (MDR/TAP) protein 1